MKKYLIVLPFMLLINICLGQTEKANYKAVVDDFEKNYNSDSFDAVFLSFADEMKVALPLIKTKEFLTGLKNRAGKISGREFLKYESSWAVYKTIFERTTLLLNISIDDHSKINGLLVKPFADNNLPKMERNTSRLSLPFKGEWTVFWGGDTEELNYHVKNQAQKNAFDMVITDKDGRTYKNGGSKNENYYAFGKELFSPCDGEVVSVIDSIRDNVPGVMNASNVLGNFVVIKTTNNEYLFFAHFKQHSIKVKQGDKVKRGQLLGLCGNSGNSSEAHLHFHIQNGKDLNTATGVKCYFDKMLVNGIAKTDYSPQRGEKLKSE